MAGVSCSGVLLLLPRRPMVRVVIQSQDTLYEQINEKEKNHEKEKIQVFIHYAFSIYK